MTTFTAPCLSLPLWESKIRQHFLQGSARSAWPWHLCRSSGGGSNYALKEQGCQGFVPPAQWERMTPVHCKGPPSSSQAGSLHAPEVDSSPHQPWHLSPPPLPPHLPTALPPHQLQDFRCPVLPASLRRLVFQLRCGHPLPDSHPRGRADPAQGGLQTRAPLLSSEPRVKHGAAWPPAGLILVDSQMVHLSQECLTSCFVFGQQF